jgi:hypothetical protein
MPIIWLVLMLTFVIGMTIRCFCDLLFLYLICRIFLIHFKLGIISLLATLVDNIDNKILNFD